MKVALDSTPRFVSGGGDARARRDEFGTGGRVRDGRCHELAESGKTLLRVRRERFVARRPGDDEAAPGNVVLLERTRLERDR